MRVKRLQDGQYAVVADSGPQIGPPLPTKEEAEKELVRKRDVLRKNLAECRRRKSKGGSSGSQEAS